MELIEELRRRDIRLWREGDNLRFSAPTGALTAELRMKLTAQKAELLAHLAEPQPAATTIPLADRSTDLPLSFAQERLWVVDRLEPGLAVYNVSHCWRIAGPLDPTVLERSLQEIERRHEVMRTTFSTAEDGTPVQTIHPFIARPMPVITVADDELAALARQEAECPFDLVSGPLWRAKLARLGEQDHALFFTWHHTICDAWSDAILARELTAIYAAFHAGGPSPLPELPLQYGDYAHWQREICSGPRMASQLAFWRERLRGDRAPLPIPADRPRPVRQTHRGAVRTRELPSELAGKVRTLARDENVTLFIFTLAAFKALLARYSGESDICLGTPIMQRPNEATEELIGFFLNTIALRSDLSGDPSFRELLQRVRATVLDAFQHQDVPFEKVVEDLHPTRTLSHQPLFQVAFVLQPLGETAPAFPGASVAPLATPVTTAKFDLTLFIQETGEGLRTTMEYSVDQFDAPTVDRMLACFETLLGGIVADPTIPLARLPLLTAEERGQLISGWNQTALDFPGDTTLSKLVAKAAQRTPAACAVIDGHARLTYGELDRRAHVIAARLRTLGVSRETFVGICMGRSADMIAAILGVLYAGGAYVPMDPNYPPDRLALILADSRAAIVLCDAETAASSGAQLSAAHWENVALIPNSEIPPVEAVAKPEDIAYLIYTSGSTGKPKGVALEHRGTVAFVHWALQVFPPEDLAGVLAATSICFDLSIFEIFVPLTAGGTIILAENILEWPALPSADAVTLVNTVPSAMAEMVRGRRLPPNVRTVNLAGEPLSEVLVSTILESSNALCVFDLYGPTETTTYSTFTQRAAGAPATIGRPIANTQIHLLDAQLQPVPIGVTGDLYISGAGLARGYWERPELTAERFITNPFYAECPGASARLYKTGDLARWRPDGQLVYLGRSDHQVKVRGFRIELGEIESVLTAHRAVREAVVLAHSAGEGATHLVAYIVPRGEMPPTQELRTHLKTTLPDYMVPSAFVPLGHLPLTPNGKLDRRALPVPGRERATETELVAPRNSTEARVAAIWRSVLKIDRVGVNDDFFAIGGHSLLAIQLLAKLRETFRVDVPVRHLFDTPTVEGVAKFIVSKLPPLPPPRPLHSLIAIQRGDPEKRPFFLIPGGWGGEVEFLVYAQIKRHIGTDLPIYGLKARGFDGIEKPHSSVSEMVVDYVDEIRTVQPHGPYLLGGECIGGVLAYEMARRLEELGEEIGLLVLLDTERPSRLALREFCVNERIERWNGFWRVRILQPYRDHMENFSRLPFGEKVEYVWQRITRKRGGGNLQAAEPTALDTRKVLGHYPRLLMAHPIGAYAGKVTLLLDETSYRTHGNLGWDEVKTGGLEVHLLPGDHLSYIREHAASAAAKLRELIERTPHTSA